MEFGSPEFFFRTDYVEVTVFDGFKKPLADFRVHPWYKIDKVAADLLLPGNF